jgi:tail collar domain
MERRSFLKSLALAPLLPSVLKGMDWASLAPEAAAAEGLGGYSALVPAGTILPYVGESVPPGFILCDGRALPTMLYRNLHVAIGKAYGGGRGVFRTPDLANRPAAALAYEEQAAGFAAAMGAPPAQKFTYVIKS